MATASEKKLVYPLKVDALLYRDLGEVARNENRTVAAVLRRAARIYVDASRNVSSWPTEPEHAHAEVVT